MKQLLSRFWSDTSAAVAFESVIVMPLLIWAWVGTFTFFDAYRTYNTSVKATYTVADLLSRQTDIQYPSDIDGMSAMLDAMIRNNDGVEVRVTQILRTTTDTYSVDWSHATGTLAALATPNLTAIEAQLPAMAQGERVVLVESFINYVPTFNMGLLDLTFENFTLTRPRYAGQVRYDPVQPTS
ncbi:TadE/TadG family type IV pilus assembly protein [Hasllibacter sp. MH4015]|uniref:TadE/TadG family type IV pilus assembly protein n=1 Tax=Hasllibacter sp. MH4015 TaxID=2854029 RepID=UPI001CD74F78|nr:pilus assembly protein [Hasllibacter sp. MH4015]